MEIKKINYQDVLKGSEQSDKCFKCSSCSKVCPITSYVKRYNIENSYVVNLYSFDNEDVLRDVWLCCVCEQCYLVCALEADPPHVFNNLKEQSYKQGLAPDSVYGVTKRIVDTGNALIINSSVNRARSKVGLGDIVLTDTVADEIKVLANKTGLKIKE